MEVTKLVKKREQLRQEAIDTAAYLLKKRVLKKALYEFHGIIALGQFINLGILLVGNVSSIYNILVEMEDVGERLNSVSLPNWANPVEDDDDMGVEIDITEPVKGVETAMDIPDAKEDMTAPKKPEDKRDIDTATKEPEANQNMETATNKPKLSSSLDDINSIFGEKPRKKHKKERKEKKDKKKKKSAIDDIFG